MTKKVERNQINVRLTKKEMNTLEKTAYKLRTTKSEVVRLVMEKKLDKIDKQKKVELSENERLEAMEKLSQLVNKVSDIEYQMSMTVKQINAVGVNVNQAVKRINAIPKEKPIGYSGQFTDEFEKVASSYDNLSKEFLSLTSEVNELWRTLV